LDTLLARSISPCGGLSINKYLLVHQEVLGVFEDSISAGCKAVKASFVLSDLMSVVSVCVIGFISESGND
jgi:hypothetical protein